MTKIKNKLLVVLTALLVFSLAFSLAMATPTTTKATEENAVTPTVNVTTILMDEGASVRTETSDGIDSGIRFTMYINAEYYASLTNPVVGMYIARATDATEDDMKAGTLPEKYQHVVATNALAGDAAETVEDTKSFNAVIFNIPEEEFGTALIANGYIVADGVEIEYAINPQTRSIAQVASVAIANGLDDEVLFNYVDTAYAASGTTLAFETETATLDRYLDEGKSADLGLTVPENFTAIVTSSDPDVATVDADGNVTRGTKAGTTTIKAQLGSAEVTATVTVTAEKPEIVTVNSENYKDIWNNDIRPAYKSATDLESAGITGSYKGNASRFEAYYANKGYKVLNWYSIDELNAIAQDYDSVSLWVAVGGYVNGTLGIYDILDPSEGRDAFLTTALGGQGHFTTLGLVNNVWSKVYISIEEYIDLLVSVENGDKGRDDYTSYCPLYRNWNYNINSTVDTKAYIYIGDIAFENVPVYPKVDNPEASITRVNMTAEEWAADGITGDYTGTAKKFHMTGANQGYKYTNPYTEAELKSMPETTTVTLNIAINLNSGGFYLYETGFEGKANPGQTNFTTTSGTIGMWLQWTISITDYIELVSANNYEFFKPWTNSYGEGVTGGIDIYFGELVFA
ncbi:MAG: hypothetical protein IJV95_02885 [Clostridia bacterium]|nr:hypothetical protein [Clostridia bacterium]